MSSLEAEEDTELRDLVASTLQSCGVLGKIKVIQVHVKDSRNKTRILRNYTCGNNKRLYILIGSTSFKRLPCPGWRRTPT